MVAYSPSFQRGSAYRRWSYIRPRDVGKSGEGIILAVFCLFSVILGWVAATGARDIGIVLYPLSVCFFGLCSVYLRLCELSMLLHVWRIFCLSSVHSIGGVAQLVRACGSYPQCPGFKSLHRHPL